mmetsp:Transcript_138985/g.443455  ORF Transcript_138985/g.443455 Transcript_138985/m.443455 type:complete len:86 (+) Transcript_138985:351-608(+)
MYPPEGCSFPRSGMFEVLKDLTPKHAKLVSGNCMRLLTQSAFMLFILSNCVHVGKTTEVPKSMEDCSACSQDAWGDRQDDEDSMD